MRMACSHTTRLPPCEQTLILVGTARALGGNYDEKLPADRDNIGAWQRFYLVKRGILYGLY
jgi:hypothetical protein